MNYLQALLIGIDCYLPNELPDGASDKSLKGCVRDITHVEAFLKRQFNLPSERIYKLTASNVDESSFPSEPPEQLPTYENIVARITSHSYFQLFFSASFPRNFLIKDKFYPEWLLESPLTALQRDLLIPSYCVWKFLKDTP